MSKIVKLAAAAVLSLSAVSFTATAASAGIVCNGENVCWHTHTAYTYRPEWGVTAHPNHWRWGANDHYTWREHRGRGYWRNGAWVTF